MKIELVSFVNNLSDNVRLQLMVDIINKSEADIILFSGYTLKESKNKNFLLKKSSSKKSNGASLRIPKNTDVLTKSICNKNVEAFFEIPNKKYPHCIYRLSKGILKPLNTTQYIVSGKDIRGNEGITKVINLINELETIRTFEINGMKILILLCGEINILRNLQNNRNQVEFRLSENVDENGELKNEFYSLLRASNIIFNPIHKVMRNQGKMKKRREFFSKDNRYYFSTSNTGIKSNNLEMKSLQYAYFNEEQIKDGIKKNKEEQYISRIYEIK